MPKKFNTNRLMSRHQLHAGDPYSGHPRHQIPCRTALWLALYLALTNAAPYTLFKLNFSPRYVSSKPVLHNITNAARLSSGRKPVSTTPWHSNSCPGATFRVGLASSNHATVNPLWDSAASFWTGPPSPGHCPKSCHVYTRRPFPMSVF